MSVTAAKPTSTYVRKVADGIYEFGISHPHRNFRKGNAFEPVGTRPTLTDAEACRSVLAASRSAADAGIEVHQRPECEYCGCIEGLRVIRMGFPNIRTEYTCEVCFTPRDDGPCFDDLPEA